VPGATSPRRWCRARGDKGYAIALTTLLLIPLVVFTAFATDVGQWYAQATRMQRAADAAALAGVVWIDDKLDPNRWRNTAFDVAGRNGWVNGAQMNGAPIQVSADKVAGNRVKVTITANAMVFFGALVQPTQTLTRSAVAEFNLSVPLGSPRNYLGTGNLGSSASIDRNTPYERENVWLANSGQCTDKAQGDRKAAYTANGGSSNTCSGAQNPDYSTENYLVYIELPQTRSYATDVLIYNGNFTVNGTNCGTSTTPTREFCPGGLPSGMPLQPTTFTLYRADETVLDDSDNPAMSAVGACAVTIGGENGSKTFNPRTDNSMERNYTFDPAAGKFTGSTTTNGQIAASDGWWRLCQIPASAPGGRYFVRVRNQASATGAATNNNGSNAYSIVANRSTNPGLCDSRTDASCPKVYAKDFLSVYATASGTSQFFLAEVGPQHAGKVVQIELWDSAEGAQTLRIQRPTTCTGWEYQTFDWSAGSDSAKGVSSIPIGSYNFNNKLLTINFQLPTSWNPPACNQWFRIEYTYSSSATDRTTWSLKLLGDPVHLVG
jgi:hypothetical protein